ncbi:cupin domain-containing protein [Tomitella gaofuii]|uniref:cupin domain-containing protein n=1 Tax=Tomitella gaofuii TaxID=2760083 RepID=UPI0015FB62C8|nr:cupin domain-containing protein [Tomitella gaofuii]
MFVNTSKPLDLHSEMIRLRPGGGAVVAPREHMADGAAAGERIVAAFRAEDDSAVHPDVWERHPDGEEVLYVRSGAVRVHLHSGDGADSENSSTVASGEAFVVPRGRWHRLSVVEPADLVTITPPVDTGHMPVSGPSPTRR